MNKITAQVLLATILSVFATVLLAEEATGNKFTITPKYGQYQISIDDIDVGIGAVKTDGDSAMGLNFAYSVSESFALELEMLRGSMTSSYSFSGPYSDISGSVSGDVDTLAMYGAYRSSGKGYFMAKLGLLNEKVSIDDVSESEMGLSAGIGGGIRFNDNFSAELEYTIIEQDVSFLGLGARFSF